MKVKELIDILKDETSDAEVIVYNDHEHCSNGGVVDEYSDILSIKYKDGNKNIIVLDTVF